MSNEYFTATGNPATRAPGSSSVMRSQFSDVETAFDKLPALAGNANKAVVVNPGATGLMVTTGTLSLTASLAVTAATSITAALTIPVALTTAGSGSITLTGTGATNVTLPTTGTLATLAGAETLTNKTINGSANTVSNIANASLVNSSITINGSAVSLGGSITVTAVASSIVVGTTTVSSGNNGRVLYNNGGTLGEYTVTGTAGSVVLSASPTLSGTIGGALAFSGALTLSSALTYGGVTLSNAVTGTGLMVLSASPTLTGTLTAGSATFSGPVGISLNTASPGNFTVANIGAAGPHITLTGASSNKFIRVYGTTLDIVNSAYSAVIFQISDAGDILVAGTTALAGALTYGGVTLSNSVTGTGSMVLSANPTLTGTLTATTISASGNITTSAASGNPTISAAFTGSAGAGQGILKVYNTAVGQIGAYLYAFTNYSGIATTDNTGAYTADLLRFAASSVTTMQPVTMFRELTYGGVTLSNSVTGTGSMVLSANPRFTGSVGIGTTNPRTALELEGPGVSLSLTSSTSASDERTWDIFAFDDYLSFRALNDAYSAATSFMHVTRAGYAVTGVSFPGGNVEIANSLVYGGVTLSNSVTGTGSMVLSASPTLSGTIGGALAFSGALTLSSALTYGGVTLSNAVTGTGSMVLSANPTFTGTINGAYATFTGDLVAGTLGASTSLIVYGTNAGDALKVFNSAGTKFLTIKPENAVGQVTVGYWTGAVWGSVNLPGTVQIDGSITYGGVTLSNSVTGTGSMVLSSAPTLTNAVVGTQSFGDNSTKAASTAYVDAAIPTGTVLPYAGSSAPTGYLLCYGQAVSRTTYAALFAVIGTAYGSGDGSTTFNVPDLRGRVPAGKDDMGGSAASRLTSTTISGGATTLGNAGGAQTEQAGVTSTGSTAGSLSVSVTISSMDGPNTVTSSSPGVGQNHAGPNHTHANASGSGATSGSLSVSVTGTTNAATNVQPSIILNYIIRI